MNCLICGEKLTRLEHPKTKEPYFYCHICDSYSKDESLFPTRKEELEVYSNHQNSLDQEDYVAYLKDFVHQSILPFHKGYRLLEYGSGPTPVLSHILEKDYHFLVEKYDKHYEIEKEYLDLQYDVISSTEVLEHIHNPMPVFLEWISLLPVGGIISIMTLFHPKNPDDFFEWWYIRDKTHLLFFSEKTFEWIAKTLELQIVFTDHKRMIVFRKTKKD